MPTKFYLRREASTVGGTLPASNSSISATAPTWTPGQTNSVVNTPLMTNLTLSPNIGGTAQTTLAYTTDNVTTNQRQPLLCFVSPALAAQSIPASTTELIIAMTESNTISAFWITFVLAVWRPSNGTLVGRITDGAAAVGGTLVAGPAPTSQGGPFSPDDTASDPVTCLEGDVLVLEVWRNGTVQTMATSYTNTVIYDGRVESSSTDLAALLNFGVNIALYRPPAPTDSYAQLILGTAGLLHYWRLSATSGPMYDFDGTIDLAVQGSVTRGVATPVADDVGATITAQGTTSGITGGPVADASGPGSPTDFTLEGWFNFAAGNANNRIFYACHGAPSSAYGWDLRWVTANGGTVAAYMQRGTGATLTTASIATTTDAWHHVVLTYSQNNGTILYVDGVNRGSDGAAGQFAGGPSAYNVGIGNNGSGSNSCLCTVDEVAFYNVVLTPAQVQTHYTAGMISEPTLPLGGPQDHFH